MYSEVPTPIANKVMVGAPSNKSSGDTANAQQLVKPNIPDFVTSPSETPKPMPVKYVKGDKGIPYVILKPNKDRSREVKNPDKVSEDLRSKYAQSTMMRDMQVMYTPKHLVSCTQSNTVKSEGPSGIEIDTIYIKASAPKDIESRSGEFFGKGITVHRYTEIPGDVDSLFASSSGVKCLPTRIRVTPEGTFIHTGKDALMNYYVDPKASSSADASATTKLHPDVEKRLNSIW